MTKMLLQDLHMARRAARVALPPMLSANPLMKKKALVRVASPNTRKVAR